ncbi:MAG: hypothetical protein RLZZ628_1978 [Bacteroidota bacterium]|jgi:hypothetical protein
MEKSFSRIITILKVGICLFLVGGCNVPSSKNGILPAQYKAGLTDAFRAYWLGGKGEVNVYDLHQERYGEDRKGSAVIVFVTEEFSKSKQVKLDDVTGSDKLNVLKMNKIYHFNTGIYDYSMMESVFTPTDLGQEAHSVKATVSVQDWCGQVFMQMNYKNNKYKLQELSYFEKPSDKLSSLDGVILEDDIMNRLRISPESVPTGEVRMIPSLFFARLRHQSVLPARASIRFSDDKKKQRICKIAYPELKRTMEIWFDQDFPHKIQGWQEKSEDKLVSAGTLKKTLQTEYWQKNAEKFRYLRDSLGLK